MKSHFLLLHAVAMMLVVGLCGEGQTSDETPSGISRPMPQPATAPARPEYCPSCDQPRSQLIAGNVTRVPVGDGILQWFPVDPFGTGTYDLAIRLVGNRSSVGVFDPVSGTWIDGPHDWTHGGHEWGVADYDGDHRVEYAYRSDSSIYLFDPDTGEDKWLWSFSAADFPSAFFWGSTEDGVPLVGIKWHHSRYTPSYYDEGSQMYYGPWNHHSWDVAVYEVFTGTLVRGLPGGPSPHCRIYGLERTSPEGLVIHHEVTWQDLTSHVGFNEYLEEVYVLKSNWEIGMQIKVARKRTAHSGPLDGQLLGSASCVPDDGTSGTWVFVHMFDGYAGDLEGGAWFFRYAVPYPRWQFDRNSYFGAPVGYDLYRDGSRSWICPLLSGEGWERRKLNNGAIIDTLPDMPKAFLNTFPLADSGVVDLFYVADSSVYVWDLQPDVADTDSTNDSDTSKNADSTNHADPTGDFPAPDDTSTLMSSVPREFTLRAYPNPFNAAVTLAWDVNGAERVDILNALGQLVRSYVFDAESDLREVAWDGLDNNGISVATGVYFARLITQNRTATTKIVLLK